ncbi:glycerate kinase [Enterococcus sp. PF1-24]|uniref:glycerate kinase n=1 Tax=unclassified Enterococcus TaxID=2608891 RepID=UPI0024733F42|nr:MULTISPECIES: glycerate kinase [unclassified Enterococcus]MDH6364110.1 glycerate kinase [Enterococcus sp. PFB1-1]MDH6401211.1 glycerate kinase [Enterococcus sp. PF1-24]
MKNLKIILAIDSFKGSASSKEAADWVEMGIRKVLPEANLLKYAIADGGEGTIEALVSSLGGEIRNVQVKNPLGEVITANYGMLNSQTAIIEMAEASGLMLVEPNHENALQASTYGVGQLILAAINDGAKEIYLGLGGSATTDGGVGMAQALGISFKNAEGIEIASGLAGLKDLASIDLSALPEAVKQVKFKILSDVSNPLTGENGAVYIYGPQKGLAQAEIKSLDQSMQNYAQLLEKTVGRKIADLSGAGAAGGLGAGLLAFFDTEVYQGINQILDLIQIEEAMKDADLIITGEGNMDTQSISGKAPIGVAQLAKKYQKPVIAVVGGRENDLSAIYDAGIDLVFSIVNRPCSIEEAIAEVKENMITAGETAIRAFLIK